jgi:tetratricopeptide (TPR) repeat protein
MQSISRGFIAGLVCCIVASYVHAQTPDTDLQQVIDEDLQTQAQVETDNGHSQRALALLNELVDRDPRRAGALLDAAVLYCQLGERDLSLETLARIEKGDAVPPAIQKLITFYKNSGCTHGRAAEAQREYRYRHNVECQFRPIESIRYVRPRRAIRRVDSRTRKSRSQRPVRGVICAGRVAACHVAERHATGWTDGPSI